MKKKLAIKQISLYCIEATNHILVSLMPFSLELLLVFWGENEKLICASGNKSKCEEHI